MGTQLLEDVEVDVLLDFEPYLPCEGRSHREGLSGHVPDAEGAFFVVSPCCGPALIVCEPRAVFMKAQGTILCSRCQRETIWELWRFLPVEQ